MKAGRDKTERISIEQYRALVGIEPHPSRGHKYGAKPVTYNGIRFDSTIEYQRWLFLDIAKMAGMITDLRHHPRYVLTEACVVEDKKQRAVVYEADFEYVKEGQTVTEDVKGLITQAARIKIKQFAAKFGRTVRIVKKASDPLG